MFKKPFFFFGRIRRTEYCYSFLIVNIALVIARGIFMPTDRENATLQNDITGLIFYSAIFWFGVTQAIKRCHDRDHPGWYLLVPMYYIWLFFADSKPYPNKYGPDPKGRDVSI